ncbi:MAG: polyketide synthase [Legionella sp.]|nr:MAG: polyketide synthase [Legionella sp.]PJD99665.1 MAG: polyketide synthase [Legionella sp.]
MTLYYLKSNTIAEPLIHRWYAWPMLISPATLALITLKSHMSMLRSYIQMPKMHENAVRDPNMRGGPFMDFNGQNRVPEVKAYLESMQDSELLELANGLIQLNQLLQQANGHSLLSYYPEIPEILKGYVELVYDLNNHPNFRIIEGLLYRSPFYNEQAQSILLSTLTSDQRSFVLSTPRLSFDQELVWNIPFKSKELDLLFSSREQGMTQEQLLSFFVRHFADTPANKELFLSFFTDKKNPVNEEYKRYTGDEVRIRYFGHACVLIESKNTTILVDPMISYGYKTDTERFTYDDLPEHIDYIILTHAHQDHVMLEHLLQIRYKTGTIIVPKNASGTLQDPSLKLMLKQVGFQHIIELDEMENVPLPDGEILGIPFFGEHGDLYIQSKMAYVLRLQGKSILLAADSDNIEPKLYEHLQREIPNLDVIFLGMECSGAPVSWLYGSLFPSTLTRSMDQSRRLNGSNYERAMEIIRCFDCSQIYVYAMGQEPWLGYITSIEYTDESYPIIESNQLIAQCQKEGRKAERLFLQKEIILSNE